MSIRIGISGFQAATSPAVGLSVAISLAVENSDIEIIGVDYTGLATGLLGGDFIEETVTLPWSDDSDKLASAWIDLCRERKLQAILPCLDDEIVLLSSREELFFEEGIKLLTAPHGAIALTEKMKISSVLAETKTSLCYPETQLVKTMSELEEVIAVSSFPIVLKGLRREVKFCFSHQECMEDAKALFRLFGDPLLIQEVIGGEQLSVVGAIGQSGNSLGQIALKKMGLDNSGKAWSYATLDNPKVSSEIREFLREIMWLGPYEVDVIIAESATYLLDVNPRFPDYIDGFANTKLNLPQRFVADWINNGSACEVASQDDIRVESMILVREFADLVIDKRKMHNVLRDEFIERNVNAGKSNLYWRV